MVDAPPSTMAAMVPEYRHRAEPPAGDQEVGLGGGSAFAPEAEGDHADEIDGDDGDVHGVVVLSADIEVDEGRAVGVQRAADQVRAGRRVEVVRTPCAPMATASAARSGVRSSTPIGGMLRAACWSRIS